MDAEAGNVIVIAPEVVFTKYPSLATAVNPAVLTACQSVPAAIDVVSPKLTVTPFKVKLGFANLALAIEPDK